MSTDKINKFTFWEMPQGVALITVFGPRERTSPRKDSSASYLSEVFLLSSGGGILTNRWGTSAEQINGEEVESWLVPLALSWVRNHSGGKNWQVPEPSEKDWINPARDGLKKCVRWQFISKSTENSFWNS